MCDRLTGHYSKMGSCPSWPQSDRGRAKLSVVQRDQTLSRALLKVQSWLITVT